MALFATKKEIKDEVNNYEKLTFFNKSKNVLVSFIIFISLVTFLLSGEKITETLLTVDGNFLAISVGINLILAFFIYQNHRWAMVVFCLIFVGDKITLISAGAPAFSQFIFAVIAIMVTVTSYRVADQLKNKKQPSNSK